jgi:hypothetical protein
VSCYWIFETWKWNFHQYLPEIIGLKIFGYKYCLLLGEKIKGQWQKFGTEQPCAVWKACWCSSQFEQHIFSQNYSIELTYFSESHTRWVKHWFGYCQWYYCRFGLQKTACLWALGVTQWRESARLKNQGLALLNRHRLFGPLSSVTLTLVGDSEHTVSIHIITKAINS